MSEFTSIMTRRIGTGVSLQTGLPDEGRGLTFTWRTEDPSSCLPGGEPSSDVLPLSSTPLGSRWEDMHINERSSIKRG